MPDDTTADSTANISVPTRSTIGIAIALIGTVGIMGLLALGGFAPISRGSAHPPCAQLPNVTEASSALAANATLREEIEAQGDGVRLAVATPCADDPERALIEVTYVHNRERDAIDTLLGQRTGFGVPVSLVER